MYDLARGVLEPLEQLLLSLGQRHRGEDGGNAVYLKGKRVLGIADAAQIPFDAYVFGVLQVGGNGICLEEEKGFFLAIHIFFGDVQAA